MLASFTNDVAMRKTLFYNDVVNTLAIRSLSLPSDLVQ